MSYHRITIDGGPITVTIYDCTGGKEEAYVLGVNIIREAISQVRRTGIEITPSYSKPTNIEYHPDPDPRD